MIVTPIAEKEEVKKRVKLGHLSLDKKYIVFGLNFSSSERKVSIYSEMHHALVLYDLENFYISQKKIPNDWIIEYHNPEKIWILPSKLSGEVWDDFNDGDSKAEEIFNKVKKSLEKFHQTVLSD